LGSSAVESGGGNDFEIEEEELLPDGVDFGTICKGSPFLRKTSTGDEGLESEVPNDEKNKFIGKVRDRDCHTDWWWTFPFLEILW